MGFRIEFLNFSMMKEDEFKDKPIILEEMIGATETVQDIVEPPPENTDEVGLQYVLIERRKKKRVLQGSVESRKRSWVWKYFVKLSSILYRCNLCNVLLSIKGCNTNNMNRHIRTRHPVEFSREISKIDCGGLEVSDDTETPYAIKTEEIYASDSLDKSKTEKESNTPRRSWVWSYFERITSTQAKCNICKRNISHGGNATGNMNRHLKMIHNKTGCDWVWKVMETNDDDDSYTCKICQYNKKKLSDPTKNMSFILQHLKYVHGVESGDQIITGSDWTP
ncbi:hypothetical protein K1T71_006535 [Dendrolimus kikuchii]|uniref:Uncharacterized protein n=1 Tax=Dendrolimus kikuchii TaxID=765133 RepID=A0ACC1D1F3_9NEOP|nr:hypothetical protein K1T71_006535 [Dendrolimus kikuchii]